MEPLVYLLKVTACTTLFFGFYLLGLQKLTFFKFNRFYLLTTLLLSFAIPLLQFQITREVEVSATEIELQQPLLVPAETQPVPLIQPVELKYAEEVHRQIDWFTIAISFYGLVAAVLLLICGLKLFKLVKHIGKESDNYNGLKVLTKSSGFTNCSFFNYIFIDQERLSEAELQVLLTHEGVHARQLHSADKILLMIFRSVLWFNPMIYLYDQALEQAHEYEADEITSAQFGHQTYANLLLRLAISKSEMPLVHNFVKSPVKARIKMLFNTKSKNMKKLNYILALPVVLVLVWMFAVEIVIAQTKPVSVKSKEPLQKQKELPLPNRKQTDPYFGSEEYAGKVKKMKAVDHKTLTGTIAGVYHLDDKKAGLRGYLFNTDQGTYVLDVFRMDNNLKESFKAGDMLEVVVDGAASTKQDDYIAIFPKKIFKAGQLVFEQKKPEPFPFLYESNKVRFNDGKITAVQHLTGKRILNVEANGFDFRITVNDTQTDLNNLNDYKKGDEVRLRFVHELKTGAKSYAVNDWISISKNIRTFGVQNNKLFSRFYHADGSQKVAKTTSKPVVPEIVSYTRIKGNIKNRITEMENAVFRIGDYTLKAVNATFKSKENLIIATKASVTKGGTMVIADKIIYDLNANAYRTYSPDGKSIAEYGANVKTQDILMKRIEYSADDSIRVSNDNKTIMLYGNVKLAYGDVMVHANQVMFDRDKKTGVAQNAKVTALGNGTEISGSTVRFDLNEKGRFEVFQDKK